MASWVKQSQTCGTEWIILIKCPQSALLSNLETENAHNYGFGNSLLFSSHIATNTPKPRSDMKCLQFPSISGKGYCLCASHGLFPVWLVGFGLLFMLPRIQSIQVFGTCGGLYKYDDIECSFGDCLLPPLLFLVCDCLNYSLLLAPSWPWRAKR